MKLFLNLIIPTKTNSSLVMLEDKTPKEEKTIPLSKFGVDTVSESLTNRINRLDFSSEYFTDHVHSLMDSFVQLPLQIFYHAFWLNKSLDETIFIESSKAKKETYDPDELLGRLHTLREIFKLSLLLKLDNYKKNKSVCPTKIIVIKAIINSSNQENSHIIQMVNAYDTIDNDTIIPPAVKENKCEQEDSDSDVDLETETSPSSPSCNSEDEDIRALVRRGNQIWLTSNSPSFASSPFILLRQSSGPTSLVTNEASAIVSKANELWVHSL